MVQSLENIDKSKVYANRITGLDEVVEGVIGDTLTGAVSTITTSDLTANKILISNANGKVSASDKGINDIPTDSDLVHKTGTETINGNKIFTDVMTTNNILPTGNITLGTSTNTWGKMVQFQDTTGKRIARIQPMAIDTTNNRIGMWVNNANNSIEKGIYIDSDGTTSAPTPSASDNSTQIATTAYVKAQGYTSNVGTITGIKMNGASKGTSGIVDLGTVATSDTKNTAGSTDTSSKIFLIGATSQAANPQTYSHDTVFVNTSGQLQTPTPDNDSDTTIAATTAFVKNVLKTSGAGLYTISKAANGYCKFNSGLIIQWLYFAVSNNYVTVTFPTSFSNTNYAIVQTPISNNSNFPGGAWAGIRDKTTTNVKLGIRAGAGVAADTSYSHAIAIGY